MKSGVRPVQAVFCQPKPTADVIPSRCGLLFPSTKIVPAVSTLIDFSLFTRSYFHLSSFAFHGCLALPHISDDPSAKPSTETFNARDSAFELKKLRLRFQNASTLSYQPLGADGHPQCDSEYRHYEFALCTLRNSAIRRSRDARLVKVPLQKAGESPRKKELAHAIAGILGPPLSTQTSKSIWSLS